MTTVSVSILGLLIAVVLFAPRQWALLGMMAGVLYLSHTQQLRVAGFNMFAIRFLEIAAFIRVVARRELGGIKLGGLDRALLWFYGYSTVVFLLRSSKEQQFVIGAAIDAILTYFAFRGLIKEAQDVRRLLNAFTILLIPYVSLLLVERLAGYGCFSIFGGVRIDDYVRDGRLRCFGTFSHPSLLGTLGASFLPLYIGLACKMPDRRGAVLGILLCLGIVWASNSGGPLNSAAVGVVGWLLWTQRRNMAKMRLALVGALMALAFFMQAPIWFLPARISSITGGDGWHRSALIDAAVSHLGDWWLAGMEISGTRDWLPYFITSTGGADLTNQFVVFGVRSGLFAIFLFVLLLSRAFGSVGVALASTRRKSMESANIEFLLWGFGVTIAVHVVNWQGISYFDQTLVVWLMQLAAIASMAEKYSDDLPVRTAEIPVREIAAKSAIQSSRSRPWRGVFQRD